MSAGRCPFGSRGTGGRAIRRAALPTTATSRSRASRIPRRGSTCSTNYAISDRISLFADWTNIFPHPFHSDIVRRNYDVGSGALTSTEIFPLVVRFEETVLSGGVRFNFERQHVAAPVFAPKVAPPPVVQPVVEQPAPVPPPPAPATPERGYSFRPGARPFSSRVQDGSHD